MSSIYPPVQPPTPEQAKQQLLHLNLSLNPSNTSISMVNNQQVAVAKPPDPIMRSCEESYAGSNVFYNAFGGDPLRDWSATKDPDKKLKSDLCFRSL